MGFTSCHIMPTVINSLRGGDTHTRTHTCTHAPTHTQTHTDVHTKTILRNQALAGHMSGLKILTKIATKIMR